MTQRGDIDKKRVQSWSAETALQRLAALCAKSEQCEWDLRRKMSLHGLRGSQADEVIDYLVEHRFLDEQRYARAYLRDKVRFNGWGRVKVAMMLRAKRIAGYAIKEAISEIDESEYIREAEKLIRRAIRGVDIDDYEGRMKLLRRLYARGFETDVVKMALENVLAERE